MTISRRNVLQSAGAATFLASLGQSVFAQAQIETAKIITGFAAGGTSDTICRRVAQKLQGDYAKSAVVENKTGAG
ncbi:MAG: twin-arginine translocation pathway signal protein, partial [Comamonadaceae bacterium]